MNKKLNCVLLVDDDDGTNFLNRIIIEESKIAHHIETTLNGRQALEYLTNKGRYEQQGLNYPCPELILLDINMPIMDGWEFLEAYRKLDENQKSKIIIVMLTTSFNPDDRQRAGRISAISGFTNTPLEQEVLMEIMRNFFEED